MSEASFPLIIMPSTYTSNRVHHRVAHQINTKLSFVFDMNLLEELHPRVYQTTLGKQRDLRDNKHGMEGNHTLVVAL